MSIRSTNRLSEPGGVQALKVPPVVESFNHLENALTELASTIDNLYERLRPVLDSTDLPVDKKGPPPQAAPPNNVAQRIELCAAEIDTHTEALRSLRNRLQV